MFDIFKKDKTKSIYDGHLLAVPEPLRGVRVATDEESEAVKAKEDEQRKKSKSAK